MREKVDKILASIRREGDRAVARALRRWDGVDLPPGRWRVPSSRVRDALKGLPAESRSVLSEAARNIRRFHQEERRRLPVSWTKSYSGLTVGQRIGPVDSAGLYIPGGRFAYPSTVLMTAIPARAAGVRRVVMATPPRHLTAEVLAAAALAGVDEVYQLGGVAAVGALAYGTRSVPRVDLIVGPGGAWVTEAKRQVFGAAGIDLLAGPSEIVILADAGAPADFVAADMMAQAEHGHDSRAVVVSPDARALSRVKAAVEPRFRSQCEFVKVRDWPAAAAKADELAPEHLSLCVKDPRKLLPLIRNAGAIFLGPWSPVAAGDYWAGPSHVLPTGRSARFSSGLSVQTFLKRSSVIGLSRAAARKNARAMARLAELEGLARHAESLRARSS
ncbi:MAG: histidinol dehydrogenase [Elusimicrobiota bacterium]